MRLLSRELLAMTLALTLFQICMAAGPTENRTALTAAATPAPELPTTAPAKKQASGAEVVTSASGTSGAAPRPAGKSVERVIEAECAVVAGAYTGCNGSATAYVCIAPDAGMEFIVDTAEIRSELSINDGVVSIVSKEPNEVCARAKASVTGANGYSRISGNFSAQEVPRK